MKIIGIAGGSGSGKSTLAESLNYIIIKQDNFYKTPDKNTNFDHPQSIDFSLLKKCLDELINSGETKIPVYDFEKRQRSRDVIHVKENNILILEGTLIFHIKEIRDMIDYKIFIETPENIRYDRRLKRDVVARGRTESSIKEQFFSQVAPMHNKYVEPSKDFSDIIIKDKNDSDQFLNKFEELFKLFIKNNLL